MPLFFLVCGVAFLVAALRGTQGTLIKLLEGEVTGTHNFGTWIAAILLIGVSGYYRPLRPVTNGLLVLVFVGLVISNNGVIAKFKAAFP